MKLSLGFCAATVAFTLLACTGSTGDTQGRVESVEERSFPTFEPFLASRMANFVFASGVLDGSGDGDDDLERFMKPAEVFRIEAADSGDLNEDRLLSLSNWERSWASMVPVAVSKLEPLWRSKRNGQPWTEEDCERASAVSALLNLAPKSWLPPGEIAFALRADAANNKNLDSILDWFEARAAQTECMAAMIATMDSGPWRAPDLKRSPHATLMESQTVSRNLELRLLLIEKDLPWCLQGVRNDKVIWTKRLTKVPPGSFRFSDKDPTPLGPYGFKVHMNFGEYTHVYLGPLGEFLFYFTSW